MEPAKLMIPQILEEEKKKEQERAAQKPVVTQPIQTRFNIPSGSPEEINQQLQQAQSTQPSQVERDQPLINQPPQAEPEYQFQQPVSIPRTNTQTQVSSVVMPPEYDKLAKERQGLASEAEKGLREGVKIEQAAATLEQEAIKAKQEIDESNRIKQEELAAKREADFKAIDDEIKGKADAISKFEFKDYFADKSLFQKAMLGIAAGMGQYSSTVSGGPNTAVTIIQNTINQDFQKQKATLDKLQQEFINSKGLRGITQEKYDRLSDDLKVAHAGALSKAGDIIKEKVLVNVKQPEIQQKLNENVLKLKEQANSMALELAEKKKKQVTTQTQTDVVQIGGLDPKKAKDVQDYEKGSEAIKSYQAAKSIAADFKELPDEVALAKFIAGSGGLGQGSFGPEFMNALKKRGLIDSAGEYIRGKLAGGLDPEFKSELQTALNKQVARKAKEAQSEIAVVNQMRKQSGMPLLSISEPEQQPQRGSTIFGRTSK